MPLVIAGIVQDQGYFDEQVAPRLDGTQVSFIGAVERRGALRAPRGRSRAPAPDRVRRAVRVQRRRGHGVRHAGDRIRARLDGRADRGRDDRLPRRHRRWRSRRRRPCSSPRPACDPRLCGRSASGSSGWSTHTSTRTSRRSSGTGRATVELRDLCDTSEARGSFGAAVAAPFQGSTPGSSATGTDTTPSRQSGVRR